MSEKLSSRSVWLESSEESVQLLGKYDQHFNLVEELFDVKIIPRGNEIIIEGPDQEVEPVRFLFEELLQQIRKGSHLTTGEFEYALKLARNGEGERIRELLSDLVLVTYRGKQIRPKTVGQKEYLEAIRNHDLVLAIGPAGTGKTYLALAMAVEALRKKQVQRLILTRPAVEAGEHLGFLPGDFQEKVDPYLRPIYDGLYDLLGAEVFQKLPGKGYN